MSLLSPQLEAFQAIVKQQTVHAAASTLYITQTAVTQRIRALEMKLKTTLFIRTRRGMLLTPEGEALWRYCQAVKEIEGQALSNIKGAGIETDISLRITGSTSIMRSRIIPQCLPVIRKFQNLQLHFDINDIENKIQSVKSGQSQLAIIQQCDKTPEMNMKVLKPESYVLLCTSEWKKRTLKDILENEHIVDFDPSDQLTFQYLKHYNLLKYVKKKRHFANRTESLALMMTEGIGYSLLTKEFSKPYLENGSLILLNSGKVYENQIGLTWYKRPEPPPYFSALLNAIN